MYIYICYNHAYASYVQSTQYVYTKYVLIYVYIYLNK